MSLTPVWHISACSPHPAGRPTAVAVTFVQSSSNPSGTLSRLAFCLTFVDHFQRRPPWQRAESAQFYVRVGVRVGEPGQRVAAGPGAANGVLIHAHAGQMRLSMCASLPGPSVPARARATFGINKAGPISDIRKRYWGGRRRRRGGVHAHHGSTTMKMVYLTFRRISRKIALKID